MKSDARASRPSEHPKLPATPKNMVSPISFLWCLLSILCSGGSFFCFLQPFWIVEPRRPHCLGVFGFCVNVQDVPHLRRDAGPASRQPVPPQQPPQPPPSADTVCGPYSGYFSFASLPSNAWRATCILFGGGCLLQSLCALVAVCTLFMRPKMDRFTARVTGFLQGVAVLLCIGGLLTYPVGFGSPVVEHFCSRRGLRSGVFRTGACELGWSYLLGAMISSLALFCPILASLYDIHMCLQVADGPEGSTGGTLTMAGGSGGGGDSGGGRDSGGGSSALYPTTERFARRIFDRSFASAAVATPATAGRCDSLLRWSEACSSPQTPPPLPPPMPPLGNMEFACL